MMHAFESVNEPWVTVPSLQTHCLTIRRRGDILMARCQAWLKCLWLAPSRGVLSGSQLTTLWKLEAATLPKCWIMVADFPGSLDLGICFTGSWSHCCVLQWCMYPCPSSLLGEQLLSPVRVKYYMLVWHVIPASWLKMYCARAVLLSQIQLSWERLKKANQMAKEDKTDSKQVFCVWRWTSKTSLSGLNRLETS